MPLNLVRARDARTLWEACGTRFLEQVGENPGPADFGAHIWLAQESQVDLLYEAAHARGVKGWLGPPVTTLRHLAARFDIRARRLGLLTRRRVISRVARNVAREVGLRDPSRSDGVVRGHMLDALFGELLPEGVAPDRLADALRDLDNGDAFSRSRNDWIVGTYRGYLDELARRERIDARQTSAMVADIIDAGGLGEALGGAGNLHLYGLYMARSRQRLLTSLARQAEVEVQLYLLAPTAGEPESSEWDSFAEIDGGGVEDLEPGRDTLLAAGDAPASETPPTIHVQPAPDTQRETEWVARQVKRLLAEHEVEPHRIAVVARSGHDDTGRIHRALLDTGVTATTIVRARLVEIAALKALLSLFRGAAAGWTYRTLRPVLDNTLLDIRIDLRTIDFIAHTRRVEGLERWEREIERLIAKLEDADASGRPKDRDVRGSGLFADAVGRDLEQFRVVRSVLESLAAARSEAEWIDLTLRLLRDEHPAAFHLRRRLCDPIGGRREDNGDRDGEADPETLDAQRWDIVRLDQRGVRQTEVLLREWLDLDHPSPPLDPAEWRRLLQRMLEGNELSITTPVHKGVQVLEAHDAALLPFDHVLVVHANDRVFPRPTPAGGVLSNDERARLCAAGIPLTWRDLELQRERALWRAVTSAGEITVTYRTSDPSGAPLLPSLLVPDHDPTTELPRTRTHREADDVRFVPVTAAQANQQAAVALHDHLEKVDGGHGRRADSGGREAPVLHPGTPELIPHAIVGAVAESYRDTGAVPLTPESPALRPNPWNGWLRDPRVLDWLAKRFGDDYRWSASGLEAYSKLPFQFLLDRVLDYEEAKEADEEVTPLVFGWMAHALLEKFYARVKDDLPTEFTDRAHDAFETAAAEVLADARADDRWLGAEVLWEQQWERIRDNVRSFLEWELVHLAEKGERPELIEHSFGFGDDPVYIEGEDTAGVGARLRLHGRIDRVDLGTKGHQVLDYKSGGTPGANDYDDGSALQAPLYMQALENDGREMSLGYYRSLKPSKRRLQYGGRIERRQAKYDDALRYALSIPGRIRDGLFEPVASMKSKGWAPWHADRDVARSEAELSEGNRYEHAEPLSPEPAPGAGSPPDDLSLEDTPPQQTPPAGVDDESAEAQGTLFELGSDDA